MMPGITVHQRKRFFLASVFLFLISEAIAFAVTVWCTHYPYRSNINDFQMLSAVCGATDTGAMILLSYYFESFSTRRLAPSTLVAGAVSAVLYVLYAYGPASKYISLVPSGRIYSYADPLLVLFSIGLSITGALLLSLFHKRVRKSRHIGFEDPE